MNVKVELVEFDLLSMCGTIHMGPIWLEITSTKRAIVIIFWIELNILYQRKAYLERSRWVSELDFSEEFLFLHLDNRDLVLSMSNLN